jgi:hypothetical protein
MAIKKSQLYSSIWKSCDELRGGMDASQYKDYVLVLLFIKYISDKYAGVTFAPITVPACIRRLSSLSLEKANERDISHSRSRRKKLNTPFFHIRNSRNTPKLWMATIEQTVKGEMNRISQRLTQRIKELAERYETPLPILVAETETLAKKVDGHLKKMGFAL